MKCKPESSVRLVWRRQPSWHFIITGVVVRVALKVYDKGNTMIFDYDRAFREQHQFLPPADALNAEGDRSQLDTLKQFGKAVYEHCLEEITEREREFDTVSHDLEESKHDLHELKEKIINALDADIPNLSDIRKLCED